MNRAIIVLAIFLTGFLGGCGPQTIWLRPSLDTPSQHVANGNQLLKRGKLSDACREFRRAREIDPNYTMAYIGLGIALGKKGDVENGLAQIRKAEMLAADDEERAAVRDGYERLQHMIDAGDAGTTKQQ